MHILYCDHISFTYTPVHRYVNGKCYEYCSSYGDQLYVITSVCMLQNGAACGCQTCVRSVHLFAVLLEFLVSVLFVFIRPCPS